MDNLICQDKERTFFLLKCHVKQSFAWDGTQNKFSYNFLLTRNATVSKKKKKSIEFFTQRPLLERKKKTIKSLLKCHCQLKVNKENKMTPNWNATINAFSLLLLLLLLLLLPPKITLLGTEYKLWFHILLRLHRQKRISNYSNTSEEKKLNNGFRERICSLKPFWVGHCLCSCFVSGVQ